MSYDDSNDASRKITAIAVLILVALVIVSGGIGGCLYATPHYNLYVQEMHGKAALAEATFTKQIAIDEAKAKLESAKLLSEAEIERARGVAEANEIISGGLKNNKDYLHHLYIQGLTEGNVSKQIIYVPTEAGLPILESGRVANLPELPEPSPQE